MILDFRVQDVFTVYQQVNIRINEEGINTHVEFPVTTCRNSSGEGIFQRSIVLHRGVYGYVSFGYGTANIGEEGYGLLEGAFVNWKHSTFRAPPNTLCNFVRVWMRSHVQSSIRLIHAQIPTDIGGIILKPHT